MSQNAPPPRTTPHTAEGAPFIGVDGEAIQGRYVLLAAGRQQIWRKRGIGLIEAIEWLSTLGTRGIMVGFSFHYDVCMLVRDMKDNMVRAILSGEDVEVGGWLIRYIARHLLSATQEKTHVRIFDVWGFFQSSFEVALDRMHVPAPKAITWGKRNRARFQWQQRNRIEEYNQAECAALEMMCGKLREGMRSQGLEITMWYGPGALAGTALSKARARDQIVRCPAALRAVFDHAYFGGRIETLQLGHFPDATIYDVNSAYPEACLHLWDQSTKGQRWRFTRKWEPDQRHSVWQVSWNLPEATYIGPLPFRRPDARIYFPRIGRGWYWWPEVELAKRLHGDAIRVHMGHVWDDGRPTVLERMVRDLYHRRQLLKAENRDIEAHVVKLTLNSLYGKMAQSVGKAPYQSFAWAGYVTSWVRARLRQAIYGYERDVIAFATDGVFLRGKPRFDVRLGEDLGQWKREDGWTGWILGSGVYRFERTVKVPGGYGREVRDGKRGGPALNWPDVLKQLDEKGHAIIRDEVFVSPLLAILMPKAFGPHRGRWMKRERAIAPWLAHTAKRHYEYDGITSWAIDACNSSILDGWPNEMSEPFDHEWKNAPAGLTRRTELISPEENT